MRRVLYAVGSWGLGHATRSLPLLRGLVEAGCSVTIVSTGRALTLLRQELGNRCTYLDWPDVPQPLGRSATAFYVKSALSLPKFFATFREEHRRLLHLLRREPFDLLISDNRYGIQHREIPSFHVLHGLRFIAPGRVRAIELLLEYFNFRWFTPVRGFLIPDEEEDGLSGDLSHHLRFFPRERLHYIGILASLRRLPVEEEIDAFVSISGPEPQRTILERIVLEQVQRAPGRIVVALGRPEVSTMTKLGNAEVYTYLPRRAQEAFMNRSKVIVARSGYTTIMELAALRKRALLIPTPGQTEQVYLASYHKQRGTAHAVWQHRLDLARDLPKALSTSGLQARSTTEEAVQRFLSIVLGESAGRHPRIA
ncbi:MAG: glycosyltransferase [Armatimonadota bacterium]|nr:glycosyltransferase [Armatimonadota bacterium]